MSDETCLSLLQRVKQGRDATDWRRFFDLYSQLIHKWLARQGVALQDVENLRQDVMLVVMRELPQFEHSGRTGAFRCWLRNVTAHQLRSMWWAQQRSSGAVGGSHCLALAEQLEDPESRLSVEWNVEHDRHVCAQLLEMAGKDFQPQTMEAFRRVVIDGRKAPEVAAALGMSPNAVRIARFRVLARLRELGAGLLDSA